MVCLCLLVDIGHYPGTDSRLDSQAQREGGYEHWLALPGDGHG